MPTRSSSGTPIRSLRIPRQPDETTEPEDTTDPDKPGKPGGKLPQTGQLWWPVPVLLFLGCALVLLGLFRRRGNCHEENR